ncbi:DUF429 domain-containing protein [Herbiconiux liukaitaii]|uniref:DUF429 domain-containing protein n=1 Tax=Herbiconiux liukaitaii TaxID=3342799 RepID=UPI0035BB21E8
MLTAGVDLAAEPKGTALAVIDWSAPRAVVTELHLGVADPLVVETARRVDKLGIDCALGWPDEFVRFVSQHSRLGDEATGGAADGGVVDGGMDWRRTLAYRETDREVRRVTGRWPLSVSTDRLGLTALRCAGLLGRLEAADMPVDRSGAGLVAEVYPGASLRLWGFDTTGYRVDPTKRRTLLVALLEAAPWLDLGAFDDLMVTSCDAFDAVIAALSARACALELTTAPPTAAGQRARREGWVHLPTTPLTALAPTAV